MLTHRCLHKVGYVYGNLMVNVHLKTANWWSAIGIVQRVTGVEYRAALKLLEDSNGMCADRARNRRRETTVVKPKAP